MALPQLLSGDNLRKQLRKMNMAEGSSPSEPFASILARMDETRRMHLAREDALEKERLDQRKQERKQLILKMDTRCHHPRGFELGKGLCKETCAIMHRPCIPDTSGRVFKCLVRQDDRSLTPWHPTERRSSFGLVSIANCAPSVREQVLRELHCRASSVRSQYKTARAQVPPPTYTARLGKEALELEHEVKRVEQDIQTMEFKRQTRYTPASTTR